MQTLYYIVTFVVGMIVFSFANVVIYRLPLKKNIIKEESACENCGHKLSFAETIPVFSWIFLGGKCKHCEKKISVRYPLVEFFGGVIALVTALYFGFTLKALTVFLFLVVMCIITFIDIDTMEIPPVLNAIILVLGVISIFTMGGLSIWDRLIGLVCISVPMYILVLLTNGFGGGDVKLMFAAGFLLGWKAMIVAFLIGVILGGIVGVYFLASKKKDMKGMFAFGPCLCVGLSIAVFVGEKLLQMYIDFLMSFMTMEY